MSNATAYADECHDAREALQKHVRPYIVPELPDPRSSYGWSGGGCPNKYQREAIAEPSDSDEPTVTPGGGDPNAGND